MWIERFGEGQRWRDAARALGLAAYRSTAAINECGDWQTMRGAVGNPMSASYAIGDLMVGGRNGRSVIVGLIELTRTERGTFPDRTKPLTTYHVGYETHAVSAVEPPLGIGLSIQPTGSPGGGAHLRDVVVGHGSLDARYHIASADPERARTLLRTTRGEGWDAANTLVELAGLGFFVEITDSYVRIWKKGRWMDPLVLGAWLDHATWLAGTFAEARAKMPPADYEARYADALEAAASELGLEADRDALTIHGWLGHVGVHVYIGSVRGGVYTAVVATIPFPLAMGLRIEPEVGRPHGPHPGLVDILFGRPSDVQVGAPALDARLRIEGYPEVAVRWAVRAIGPKILDVLGRVRAFQILGNTIRLELRRVETHAPYLVHAIRDAVELAQGLSAAPPAPQAATPYR